jgi:large subunit ribosomal protein L25
MSNDRNTLEAKVRDGSGKGFARRLRAQKMIPAVVYGRKMDKPLQISVDPLAVRKAVATPHKYNTLLSLKVEGQPDQLVLLKDFQSDPVTRDLLHADFIGVAENEQVKVNVPVALVGKAEGVLEGGILEQKRRQIEVWALPTAIPATIEFDVSKLKVTQALHINDVKMPEGISVKSTVNYTIAVVTAPDAEVVAAPAAVAAAVPGAAGAAAPASGAAPAAAAAKKEGKK